MGVVGMILAMYGFCMEQIAYEMLTSKRDELVKLQTIAVTPKHRAMIAEQLATVRGQIKNAHKEQYDRTQQNNTNR